MTYESEYLETLGVLMKPIGTEKAEVVVKCAELDTNIKFFESLGFNLETIFPADNPRQAGLSGFGLCLRLEVSANGVESDFEITIEGETEQEFSAPCGVRVIFEKNNDDLKVPQPDLSDRVVRTGKNDDFVVGRAGMNYRDLIPGRLGGFMIASHIQIPKGGPVPDYVHHHSVRFQIIFCRTGNAKLVYEDQGAPFVFEAGDCVLQPSGIRHRVLECSDNFEVVEVSCPAEHKTFKDNEMELPNSVVNSERMFEGQRFLWSRSAEETWKTDTEAIEIREMDIGEASGGVVAVRMVRLRDSNGFYEPSVKGQIVFIFVNAGTVSLKGDEETISMETGDSFVIHEGVNCMFPANKGDAEILEVSVPI